MKKISKSTISILKHENLMCNLKYNLYDLLFLYNVGGAETYSEIRFIK